MLLFGRSFLTILAVMLIGAAAAARAQDYPTRPITAIVPFAGGSASDVVSRILFDHMSKSLGQPIVVENRPGAGGNSGTADAAKAAPDGYTIVGSGSGPVAANVTLYKHLDYDPQKDLVTISPFASFTIVVVASSKLPINNLQELIGYAKAHPGELNYGSVGIGSSQHLAGEYFAQLTGVMITHVPYRNIGQYVADLMSGQVPLGFQWYPNVSAALAAKGARGRGRQSPRRAAGCAHHQRGGPAAIRRLRLVCVIGAARDTAGDRRQAQQRAEGGGRGSCGARAVCAAGRRSHLHDAGPVQEVFR